MISTVLVQNQCVTFSKGKYTNSLYQSADNTRKPELRFVQQIENKFIGDDGRVTPVINIHVEVPDLM